MELFSWTKITIAKLIMLHTWTKNMNKIFVDTDVILDLLARRLPHFHFSAVLFTFAEMKKLELFTTPMIFANTFYIRDNS